MGTLKKRDFHVVKYFSSRVYIAHGKVAAVSEPTLVFCPLARSLYKGFRYTNGDKKAIKAAIKNAIESKIKEYGFFTDKRNFLCGEISIPYGASEMLSFALRKKTIDAAVIVCEGAGTVVAEKPDIVQGIGARMNTIVGTSPIRSVIERLKSFGCGVVSESALIDQIEGVKHAIKAGHKTIAVTVRGDSAGDLKTLRLLEKKHRVKIVVLAVCTTGAAKNKIALMRDYADVVWSCASLEVRRVIGPCARCQLSRQLPVFVLTQQGIDFVAAYVDKPQVMKNLDTQKQYLFSHDRAGQRIRIGNRTAFINEATLPADARIMPRFGAVSVMPQRRACA